MTWLQALICLALAVSCVACTARAYRAGIDDLGAFWVILAAVSLAGLLLVSLGGLGFPPMRI
jgi:hypothetical protein